MGCHYQHGYGNNWLRYISDYTVLVYLFVLALSPQNQYWLIAGSNKIIYRCCKFVPWEKGWKPSLYHPEVRARSVFDQEIRYPQNLNSDSNKIVIALGRESTQMTFYWFMTMWQHDNFLEVALRGQGGDSEQVACHVIKRIDLWSLSVVKMAHT